MNIQPLELSCHASTEQTTSSTQKMSKGIFTIDYFIRKKKKKEGGGGGMDVENVPLKASTF